MVNRAFTLILAPNAPPAPSALPNYNVQQPDDMDVDSSEIHPWYTSSNGTFTFHDIPTS